MTEGSPALRANPGLNDGIPLGFRLKTCFVKKARSGRFGRTAAVAKPSRSGFALKIALEYFYAARYSGALRLVSATQPLSVGDSIIRRRVGSQRGTTLGHPPK